jgi:hypothetical protein
VQEALKQYEQAAKRGADGDDVAARIASVQHRMRVVAQFGDAVAAGASDADACLLACQSLLSEVWCQLCGGCDAAKLLMPAV